MRFGSQRGPSEFFFSRIPFKIAWEDAVEGLGMAMSTEASEKNKELLFISNVFYKQWNSACGFTSISRARPPENCKH